MKVLPCSLVDINCLRYALLINENGQEYLCTGIGLTLDDYEVWVDLADAETKQHHSSIPFERLKNWSVQFNSSLQG